MIVNITIFAMDKAAMIVSGTTCVARSRTYTSRPSNETSVEFGTIFRRSSYGLGKTTVHLVATDL